MTRSRSGLPIVLVPHPHVRTDDAVLAGSPYIVGTRVPVRRLWAFYRNGATVDTLLRRYPQLGAAKVFDALAFAWDNAEVMEADLAREAALLGTRKSGGGTPRATRAQMELPFEDPPEEPE